jgi:hypothetical protein
VDAAMEGSIWLQKSDFEQDIQSECLSDTEEEESIVEIKMAQQQQEIKAVKMLSNEQEWTASSKLMISFNVFILIKTFNIHSQCY